MQLQSSLLFQSYLIKLYTLNECKKFSVQKKVSVQNVTVSRNDIYT